MMGAVSVVTSPAGCALGLSVANPVNAFTHETFRPPLLINSSSFFGCSSGCGSVSSSFLAGRHIGENCGGETSSATQGHSWKLAVEAKKGKGAFRGKPWLAPGGAQQAPAMPKVDENDDTPKFVLFVRSKNLPRWFPLSIVSGGNTAKVMVSAMGNEWGRKLYGGTLTRNMASVIYKDEKQMRLTAVKAYPLLKEARAFEYGYKIMDQKNPRASMYGTDVIAIPPKEELKSVVDKVKDFFGGTVDNIKDSFGSITSLPTVQNQESAPEESTKKAEK
eukprot:TRINITY_DN3444_c0_g1_i1.p1 TRINITY_DN3444_c0_g1~~TRINITY_DN3444_c0_g1_i1.p1  ORF type:complete len:276 (+),score=45.49 TRINITY_DN3444_c0_g1_i1:38-865(+)